MTSVTHILYAAVPPGLASVCKIAGFIRADIWRRFGALGSHGKSANDIRKQCVPLYNDLAIDGSIRHATTMDTVDSIFCYRAAAELKVKRHIFARTSNKEERKRLFTLLKKGEWTGDKFLHRMMRKHFRHGRIHHDNQFYVRSDKHTEEIINGALVITIKVARKYGNDIRIVATTNGKNVSLANKNLRIMLRGDKVEVHYCTKKQAGRPCGTATIGVDKGYTEALTDSDGAAHGLKFGSVMTRFSDKEFLSGKARNKLYALAEKHRKAGRHAKADRILKHNLGSKKIDARKVRARKHLRDIAFKAAHSVVDKAAVVVSEDLTAPFVKKTQWRRFNRRMSAWAKGSLADAVDAVCAQRKARHVLVAAAYTSQTDSITGLLQGRRVGDKFYRENGDVLQADVNAARNVLARLYDPDIGRFTPHTEIKRILLARSPAQLSVNRPELGGASRVNRVRINRKTLKLCS